jgi:hypothetical protein
MVVILRLRCWLELVALIGRLVGQLRVVLVQRLVLLQELLLELGQLVLLVLGLLVLVVGQQGLRRVELQEVE